VITQLTRVRRGEGGGVAEQNPPPVQQRGAAGAALCRHRRLLRHRVEQSREQRQRQSPPRRAVARRRRRHLSDVTQCADGHVAVQDLQQKQPHRHRRREQTLAPVVADVRGELIDIHIDRQLS
jgi:hypothetical protein